MKTRTYIKILVPSNVRMLSIHSKDFRIVDLIVIEKFQFKK